MTLRDQLIRDEGLRLKPYTDTVGKLTIGVGRNLTDRGITEAEAFELLENDMAAVAHELRARLPWTDFLAAPQRGVLQNMAFNLGVDGLLKFRRMLAALQIGDAEQAAVEMLDSKWAGQVGDRAQRLARQMTTGRDVR